MHSDLTLEIMDHVTSALGQQFRQFKGTVCNAYETHELGQEVRARARRRAKKEMNQAGRKGTRPTRVIGQAEVHDSELLAQNVKRTKVFNLQTYKFHALGDYVSTIRRYGTSDSYSTEPVCHITFNYELPSLDFSRANLNTVLPRQDIVALIAILLLNS
jgi:hypothetical protein